MLINTLYSNSTHLKANANKRKLEEKEIEQSIKDYVDPYLDRLDAQIKKFGFNVKYVGLDAGYFTNPIFKGISDRNIVSAIATRLGPHDKDKRIYRRRKETIERSFADPKNLHGLRYARYRIFMEFKNNKTQYFQKTWGFSTV